MIMADLYGKNGKKAGEVEVPAVFAQTKNSPGLVHQAVVRELANKRSGTAATKTRGMIYGGGAKPHRQKGTGRARAGSNRSPLWVGGGTIFGPQPRSYQKKLNKKMRQAALNAVVLDKINSGLIKIVEGLEIKEAKTKEFVALLKQLEVDGSALIVAIDFDEKLNLASRNVAGVKMLTVGCVNVHDLLKYQHLVITQEALTMVGSRGNKVESA